MGFLEWATDPWGQRVPIHIAWFLIWVAVLGGLAFFAVHAAFVSHFAQPRQFAPEIPPARLSGIPERVPRHSQVARIFHWVMAVAMLTLLFTAFLPKVGVQFPWVTYHWIAGTVLTAAVLFHLVHATFWQDFWSIWPDRIDLTDAYHRVQRLIGRGAPPPRRFAKYPLENKLYHGAILLTGLCAIATGVLMMFRVRTIFFTRDPYLFSDMTWGMVYVLHGLAGVGLIALVMTHIYFAVRPEKLPITKSMIFGWMSRDYYLEEHDPERWIVSPPTATGRLGGSTGED
jgi:cytochrome b subunit of formate dehydrogenase